MGRKGVAHNAAEVGGSEGFQEGNEAAKKNPEGFQEGNEPDAEVKKTGQGGGARKTRKGGRRKRRGGRKSRKGGRKSRKIRGGNEDEEGKGFTVGGRKKRRTKKARKGKKKRGLNPFFKLMLAAKKAGKASFKYGSALQGKETSSSWYDLQKSINSKYLVLFLVKNSKNVI